MDTLMDQDFDRDARAVFSGSMSPQQFQDNNKARADGAMIGMAIIFAPQAAAKTLVTNSAIGAGIGAAVAHFNGDSEVKGAVDGAQSAAATAIAGANTTGRIEQSLAVAGAAAAATVKSGGDAFEVGVSGAVAGIVEFFTRNAQAANNLSTGLNKFLAGLLRTTAKKAGSTAAKEAAKQVCAESNDKTC
jgi:hypothetical protein